MTWLTIALTTLSMQSIYADVDPNDVPLHDRVAVIEGCLAKPGLTEPDSCIGVLSELCQEQPYGGGTLGTRQCLGSETEAWEALMHDWLESAPNMGMNESGRAALTESQAQWELSVESSTGAYAGFSGTIYSIMASQWRLDWTARRALWVRDLATDPVTGLVGTREDDLVG